MIGVTGVIGVTGGTTCVTGVTAGAIGATVDVGVVLTGIEDVDGVCSVTRVLNLTILYSICPSLGGSYGG